MLALPLLAAVLLAQIQDEAHLLQPEQASDLQRQLSQIRDANHVNVAIVTRQLAGDSKAEVLMAIAAIRGALPIVDEARASGGDVLSRQETHLTVYFFAAVALFALVVLLFSRTRIAAWLDEPTFGYRDPGYAPRFRGECAPTVVNVPVHYNDGFVAGMVVGEALERTRASAPTPDTSYESSGGGATWNTDASSRDSGGGSDFGGGSDSGGGSPF